MAELEAKLAEKDETIAKMQEQIDALVQFKEEKENLEKMSVVNATLAQVKDKMSQEDYAKFEEKGNACKLEDVTAWKNEVLANVATILMSEKAEEDGITRMSIEIEETKPKGLWD
jgi:predicted metal-dependent hydrolase